MKKIKNIIISSKRAQYDDPIEGPLKFVKDEIVLDNVNKEKSVMKKLKKVDVKEVQNIAKKYFHEENFATAAIRPK